MLDFNQITTYPIGRRRNKFTLKDMIPLDNRERVAGTGLNDVATGIKTARANGKPVIAMLGGAVIKVGCSLVLIDLMKKGFITHLAGNGAVSIHDFEVALIGATSEDVPAGLERGTFGMAEETGRMMNEAINTGAERKWGYGRAVGEKIKTGDLEYKDYSLLYQALCLKLPATIHVAVGNDTIHQHPLCNGAALGATSFEDFKILADTVSGLSGGVLLNIGSAVIMPEVFLKVLTIVRNLGHDVRRFTAANLDFMDLYRPRTRLLEWPKALGCQTYDIRADHALSIPTLHHLILQG